VIQLAGLGASFPAWFASRQLAKRERAAGRAINKKLREAGGVACWLVCPGTFQEISPRVSHSPAPTQETLFLS